MKLVPKIKGRVEKGKFYPYEPEIQEIWMDKLEGKECIQVIEEYKHKRSDLQNKYYWGVVVKIISDELGYSRDETHSILASKFLKKIVEIKKQRFIIVRSTTSLKTNEFSEYVEKCKQFAASQLGVYIPDAEKINIKETA